MHKITACIAWHTLNDRFIVVALVQISIVSPMFQWELSFLFEGLWQLSHADTFNLVSISYFKKVCHSLTDPKIQFIKWNLETLNQIYALSCGKNEFFCCCNSSVLIKLFFACLTCNEGGDLFVLFTVWSVECWIIDNRSSDPWHQQTRRLPCYSLHSNKYIMQKE